MNREEAGRLLNSVGSLRVACVTNPTLLRMALKHSENTARVSPEDIYEALGITDAHRSALLGLAQNEQVPRAHEYLDGLIGGFALELPIEILNDLPDLPKVTDAMPELTRETFAKAIIEIDDAVIKMIKIGKTALQSNPHLRKMAFKFKLPPIVQEHEELREWAKTRYNELVGASE